MKKLNLHEVEEKMLNLNLKIFQPEDLKMIFNASQRAVQGFLTYNTKRGAFIRLKKGLYTLKRNFPQDFLLANKLYFPSYVSLDTALSYYNLIPETVYSITSVTTKSTREFDINNRSFDYRKIKKQAYTGYSPKEIDGEIVYLANPEKAVADFLYFVYLGKRGYNDRLDIRSINLTKLKEYLKLFDKKRLIPFVNRLLEENDRQEDFK